jgi:hypothetical protein
MAILLQACRPGFPVFYCGFWPPRNFNIRQYPDRFLYPKKILFTILLTFYLAVVPKTVLAEKVDLGV